MIDDLQLTETVTLSLADNAGRETLTALLADKCMTIRYLDGLPT